MNALNYPWWLASRSMGIVAYLALSGSVVLGLTMALRVAPVKARRAVRTIHERVALIAVAAIAAHGLLLLPDPWLNVGPLGVFVPFTMSYRPVWTGIGIIGGYLAAALSLSYYAKRRIGAKRWRNAHRFIPIAWLLASIHVVGAGTDGQSLWLLLGLALPVAAVVAMLGYRLAGKVSASPLALP